MDRRTENLHKEIISNCFRISNFAQSSYPHFKASASPCRHPWKVLSVPSTEVGKWPQLWELFWMESFSSRSQAVRMNEPMSTKYEDDTTEVGCSVIWIGPKNECKWIGIGWDGIGWTKCSKFVCPAHTSRRPPSLVQITNFNQFF